MRSPASNGPHVGNRLLVPNLGQNNSLRGAGSEVCPPYVRNGGQDQAAIGGAEVWADLAWNCGVCSEIKLPSGRAVVKRQTWSPRLELKYA